MNRLLSFTPRFLVALLVTILVFSYIVIRAFYTEFIADETAAYWYFVYRGWFWGDQIVWDAANHPLNSFIGHHMYTIFGDFPGMLRMGSVVSYLFYAFASYRFTGEFQSKRTQILGFVALNTIPYFIEYFGYLRGYGLSMGFFMCSLWFLFRYAQHQQWPILLLTYFFGFLGFAANLTLLNSLLLTIAGVLLIHVLHRKSIKRGTHLFAAFSTVVLAGCCWPLVQFGLKLKASGALYYSSLDGIWDMTGRSLSKYILFTEHIAVMYGLILILLLLLYFVWKKYTDTGLLSFLKEANSWHLYFFFGNLCAVIGMAVLLKVNYPEDRTGMYFVPLFLLLVTGLLDRIPRLNWILLLIPFSMLTHLSIHSSVFTPEERMTKAFYNKVKAQLKPFETVSLYKTMYANWHYLESHQSGPIHFPHTNMRQGDEPDVFIARRGVQYNDTMGNPYLASNYRMIAKDPMNDHVAYRRIRPKNEVFYARRDTNKLVSTGEFLELWNSNQRFKAEGDYKLKCSFFIQIADIRQSTDFVVTTTDENGQAVRYMAMALELNFQSKELNKTVDFSVLLDNISHKEKGLKVYLWNRKKGVLHQVKDVKLVLNKVNDEED